jgi:hypothetical protein
MRAILPGPRKPLRIGDSRLSLDRRSDEPDRAGPRHDRTAPQLACSEIGARRSLQARAARSRLEALPAAPADPGGVSVLAPASLLGPGVPRPLVGRALPGCIWYACGVTLRLRCESRQQSVDTRRLSPALASMMFPPGARYAARLSGQQRKGPSLANRGLSPRAAMT